MCNFRLPIFDFGKRRNGRCETLSAKRDLQSEYRWHALTDVFSEAGIAAARNWKRWQGARSRIAVMASPPSPERTRNEPIFHHETAVFQLLSQARRNLSGKPDKHFSVFARLSGEFLHLAGEAGRA